MIPSSRGPKLKTQITAWRKDENASKLPRIALHGGLPRPISQRTNRVSDQPRRGDLATPATKTGSAIRMQIGIHEQKALYPEFFSKRLGEAPIPIPDDHDSDALISPRLHRLTQLRDLLTTEESTKVAQENQNDGSVSPEIAHTDRLIRCRVDQCDRREASRTTQGDLLSGGVLRQAAQEPTPVALHTSFAVQSSSATG